MDQQQGQVNRSLTDLNNIRNELGNIIQTNGRDFKVGEVTLGNLSDKVQGLYNQNPKLKDSESIYPPQKFQKQVNDLYYSLQDAINTINQQQQQPQQAGRRRGTKRRGTKRRGTKRRGTKRRGTKRRRSSRK
jgi:uncharacterized protein YukE